jgi:transcriptional regulator with XRE-family HTH domain
MPRSPYAKRRKQIAALRAKGLTFQAIGDMFGVTRQSVNWLYHGRKRTGSNSSYRPAALRCRKCKVTIPRLAPSLRSAPVLCLNCVKRYPASFGQRLRAFRIAAGLTVPKLAERAGLTGAAIGVIERDLHQPRPGTVAKLVAALGPELARPRGRNFDTTVRH